MTTQDQKNYLISKYIEMEILDKNLNFIEDNINWFNPNISTINGYIPICSQCNLDFEEFKKTIILENMEVVFKHPKSCLWYDFFIKKVKISCPTAKIVRKKLKK